VLLVSTSALHVLEMPMLYALLAKRVLLVSTSALHALEMPIPYALFALARQNAKHLILCAL
jgi:hypothetical protein